MNAYTMGIFDRFSFWLYVFSSAVLNYAQNQFSKFGEVSIDYPGSNRYQRTTGAIEERISKDDEGGKSRLLEAEPVHAGRSFTFDQERQPLQVRRVSTN